MAHRVEREEEGALTGFDQDPVSSGMGCFRGRMEERFHLPRLGLSECSCSCLEACNCWESVPVSCGWRDDMLHYINKYSEYL